jgi:sucrose-6-phosphate hydrolase SacC (GH32 family)
MTVPRELSLTTIDGKITLLQNPAKEVSGSAIVDRTFTITPTDSKSGVRFTSDDGRSFDVGYDSSTKEIYIDRSNAWYEINSTSVHAAPFDAQTKPFEIRVITDTGSIELFVDGGRISITDLLDSTAGPWEPTPF